jgi:hypothetical protein
MVVRTSGSPPRLVQFMHSVVRPCTCSFLTTVHIGAPEEGFLFSSFSWLLHAYSSLAANCCCLESKIPGPSVRSDSLIGAPNSMLGSAARMDLACRFRGSWRLLRLPTSLVSHQSSLPCSVTTCTHSTWTALTLSGPTLYVLVMVRSLTSAALAFFMHQLWCSLNCAVSFTRRCLLWPRLRVNGAASVIAVSKCSSRLLAHSKLFDAHHTSIEMTWLTSLLIATQPRSSTEDSP